MKRQRSKRNSFDQKIAEAKTRFLEQISQLPDSLEREELEMKIGQLETAASWNAAFSAALTKSK
jgi:hypothetical protein